MLSATTTGADPEDPATQDGQAEAYDDVDYTASAEVDLEGPTAATYEAAREQGLTETRAGIDAALTTNDVDAIVSNAATTGNGARAGYPSLTLPAGYAAANRRPVPVIFLGTAHAEETLIAPASDDEQAAAVRRSPQEINPTAFRCTWVSPRTAPDEDRLAEPAAGGLDHARRGGPPGRHQGHGRADPRRGRRRRRRARGSRDGHPGW